MENKPKRKVLKFILLIILAIVIIFVASTIRKMIIISNLNNKTSAYVERTKENANYYTKQSTYKGTSLQERETYVKDKSSVRIISMLSQNNSTLMKQYSDGTTTNTYIQANDGKKVRASDNSEPFIYGVVDYLYVNNIHELFLLSLSASINSENCNGKDCYLINIKPESLFADGYLFVGQSLKLYIEKETGLIIREVTVDSFNSPVDEVTDYTYRFDTVTENDFIEPDVSEYEIAQ